MPSPSILQQQRAFFLSLLLSCALHLSFLLIAEREHPPGSVQPSSRLEARLQPRPAAAEADIGKVVQPLAAITSDRARPRSRLLSAAKSPVPTWSAAEKAEMDSFLDELEKAPKPTLAQRSLAMAREQQRAMAAREAAAEALLELRPNAPPVSPFSLDAYLDGMVRRMNRSAAYVQRAARNPGLRPAAVQFRLNPDGSLKSFVVLNAGDQAEEIAFIKAVVERSLPFSPFPPDIDRAARSLGITICIRPGSSGDDGVGFTRMSGGRCN